MRNKLNKYQVGKIKFAIAKAISQKYQVVIFTAKQKQDSGYGKLNLTKRDETNSNRYRTIN
jgi:hypothetical protein